MNHTTESLWLEQISLKLDVLRLRLDLIERREEIIMATQQQLIEQVNAATTKLEKIGNETRSLLTKIDALQAVIENGPAVSPELQAAVDALTAQAAVVDDLVPDGGGAPPAPPAP